MLVGELYYYIFGDSAIILVDERIANNESAKQAFIAKRKAAIQKAFEFLNANQERRELFYYFLESVGTPGANALKGILYENYHPENSQLFSISRQVTEQYLFPPDEKIKEEFQYLNQSFKYFVGEDSKIAEEDFVKFFKACKMIGDFVEGTNDATNGLAYDQAYKMLVVFGASNKPKKSIFENVTTYIEANGKIDITPKEKDLTEKEPDEKSDEKSDEASDEKSVVRKPKSKYKSLHDILLLPIPTNDPPFADLPGWRQFIQKNATALEFFQEGPAIEKKLKELEGRFVPNTTQEAQEISAKISYKRAGENMRLAKLYKQLHKSEESFNKTLEIDKRRKKKDNLPNVSVSGATVNPAFAGYHLVKLPINDPRAYVLGDITGCCQSIDGHSERCVIDGVTRENNGFYVLLKGKPNANPLIGGQINDENFTIVGQGYAWLSQGGNFVFDSWENLRPEADDKVIVPMLKKMAQDVTEQNEDIVRVTIGISEKTPKAFQEQPVANPEKIAEGFQYGDSQKQCLVYLDEVKLSKMKASFINKHALLGHSIWKSPDEFEQVLDTLSSRREFQAMEALCLDESLIQTWKNAGIDTGIKSLLQSEGCLNGLYLLQQIGMLTPEMISALLDAQKIRWKSLSNFFSAIQTLNRLNPNLINTDICLSLLATSDPKYFTEAFEMIHQASRNFATPEFLKLLIAAGSNIDSILDTLEGIEDMLPMLVSNEFLHVLLATRYEILKLDEIKKLQGISPALIDDATIKMIFGGTVPIEAINAIFTMYPQWVNKENFQLLIENPITAEYLCGFTDQMTLHAYPLLSNESFKPFLSLMKHWNKRQACRALNALSDAEPSLATDANLKILLEHKDELSSIGEELEWFVHVSPTLLTDNMFRYFIQNRDNVNLSRMAEALFRVAPELATVDHLQQVFKPGRDAGNIVYGMMRLKEVSPTLVNEEMFQLMTEHDKDAQSLAAAIKDLYYATPKLINLVSMKLITKDCKQSNPSEVTSGLLQLYRSLSVQPPDPMRFHSESNLPASTTQKMTQFLQGDASTHFDQQDIEALEKWGLQKKSGNMIDVKILTDVSATVQPKRP